MAITTPAPCKAIETKLNQKQAQLNRLNAPHPVPSGPIFKPGRDRDPELETEKKRLRTEIKALDAQLTQCFVNNTQPAPLTVRFESLVCVDQDDTEIGPIPEDDE